MLRKVHFHIYAQQLNVSKGMNCFTKHSKGVIIPLNQNRIRQDLLTLIKGVNTVIGIFTALRHMIKCA